MNSGINKPVTQPFYKMKCKYCKHVEQCVRNKETCEKSEKGVVKNEL